VVCLGCFYSFILKSHIIQKIGTAEAANLVAAFAFANSFPLIYNNCSLWTRSTLFFLKDWNKKDQDSRKHNLNRWSEVALQNFQKYNQDLFSSSLSSVAPIFDSIKESGDYHRAEEKLIELLNQSQTKMVCQKKNFLFSFSSIQTQFIVLTDCFVEYERDILEHYSEIPYFKKWMSWNEENKNSIVIYESPKMNKFSQMFPEEKKEYMRPMKREEVRVLMDDPSSPYHFQKNPKGEYIYKEESFFFEEFFDYSGGLEYFICFLHRDRDCTSTGGEWWSEIKGSIVSKSSYQIREKDYDEDKKRKKTEETLTKYCIPIKKGSRKEMKGEIMGEHLFFKNKEGEFEPIFGFLDDLLQYNQRNFEIPEIYSTEKRGEQEILFKRHMFTRLKENIGLPIDPSFQKEVRELDRYDGGRKVLILKKEKFYQNIREKRKNKRESHLCLIQEEEYPLILWFPKSIVFIHTTIEFNLEEFSKLMKMITKKDSVMTKDEKGDLLGIEKKGKGKKKDDLKEGEEEEKPRKEEENSTMNMIVDAMTGTKGHECIWNEPKEETKSTISFHPQVH
jgi:hypothetical protein